MTNITIDATWTNKLIVLTLNWEPEWPETIDKLSNLFVLLLDIEWKELCIISLFVSSADNTIWSSSPINWVSFFFGSSLSISVNADKVENLIILISWPLVVKFSGEVLEVTSIKFLKVEVSINSLWSYDIVVCSFGCIVSLSKETVVLTSSTIKIDRLEMVVWCESDVMSSKTEGDSVVDDKFKNSVEDNWLKDVVITDETI